MWVKGIGLRQSLALRTHLRLQIRATALSTPSFWTSQRRARGRIGLDHSGVGGAPSPQIRYLATYGGKSMTFDPRDFLPTPSDWFSTSPEYEGWGRAEFSDPQGSLEGPVEVRFDELGEASVQMRPDPNTLRSERELRFGLDEFLSGAEPTKVGEQWMLSRNFAQQNPCTGLEVRTSKGVFSTQDVSGHGASVVYGGSADGVESLTFDVFLSRFDAEGAGHPKYWVLPLINFVSEWRQRRADLDRHPLRIFPTPEVPDEITCVPYAPDGEEAANRAFSALYAANSRNRLVIFEFEGAPGFVERLPDYGDRKEDLLAGRELILPTAVMVGEVGPNPNNTLTELGQWMRPDDLLMLLTLATGTEVGATWIELRDHQGRLVRRFHRRLREARFSRGYRLVDDLPLKDGEGRDTGVGRLISRAVPRLEALDRLPLRSSILHLVQSKYRDQSLDESMAHLCRGLDGLCEHYGVAKQNLTESLNADQKEAVKAILAEAFKKIREVKNAATAAGNGSASDALNTIEGKVSNAANTERKFGLALADLLERCGMPDVGIVDEHFRSNPRPDGRERWVDVVSRYRTDVIHYGHLRLGPEGEGWRDVWTIINHLHDVTARILLQAFEYDGGYQPAVVPGPSVPYEVDWIKPDTPAGMLGYAS